MHFRLTESQRPAAAPGVGDTKSRVVISDFYLRHALSIIQDNTHWSQPRVPRWRVNMRGSRRKSPLVPVAHADAEEPRLHAVRLDLG